MPSIALAERRERKPRSVKGLPTLVETSSSVLEPVDVIFPAGKTALGMFQPGAAWNLSLVDAVETKLAHNVKIVNWFQGWGADGAEPDPTVWSAISGRGSIPMVTWEPWNWQAGISATTYSMASIAAGTHDAYIRRWANAVAGYGKPILIRLAHEMNGNWYPWASGINGTTPSDYIRAWRRCTGIFDTAGASNATWVWCPTIDEAGSTPLSSCYPGDEYVGLIGFDAYNGGSALNWGGWLGFSDLFGPSIRKAPTFSNRPMMICETASAEIGGSKADWISDMLNVQIAVNYPQIRAIVWFNENKEADWRIDSSSGSLAAIRAGLQAEQFAA